MSKQNGSNRKEGLKLGALIALVVGSMIGSGIFFLPQNMAASAGPAAVMIGWGITFIGMLALAFVFQALARLKPEIDSGVYGYAKAGFGEYMGFNSAWGYWISAWIGNVAYLIGLFSALTYFFPSAGFEKGTTTSALIGASLLLWCYHILVLRGISGAAFINFLTTIAKLVPLLIFVAIILFAFNMNIFTADFWGTLIEIKTKSGVTAPYQLANMTLAEQIKSTMLVTVWVFIGIEGASVYASRAAKQSDVGKATVIGFLITISLLIAVSLLSMGIMSQPELVKLSGVSTGDVLQSALGNASWAATLMNAGLVISVGGALLAWTLLSAEMMYLGGRGGACPKIFGKTNKNETPVASLWLTTICIQLFLVIAHFNKSGYLAMLSLATSMILIPYFFSGAYAFIVALQEKSVIGREKDLFVGALASVYGIWLIYAAGLNYLLLSMILYAPGIIIFIWARREQGKKVFTPSETIFAIAIVLMAIYAILRLISGNLSF